MLKGVCDKKFIHSQDKRYFSSVHSWYCSWMWVTRYYKNIYSQSNSAALVKKQYFDINFHLTLIHKMETDLFCNAVWAIAQLVYVGHLIF